jgi:uncharacterized damage-inducible protein DinB
VHIQAATFPATYSGLSREFLGGVFRAAPGRLRRAIAGLDADDFGFRPGTGKWSIQQIVFHLADSELVGAVRFRQALSDAPAPRFPAYDQDRWADALGYGSRTSGEVHAAVALFEMLRESAASLLDRVEAPGWERVGIHREWGTLSVRQLLELYADHGERHVGQILVARIALGKAAAMDSLLPERLYP